MPGRIYEATWGRMFAFGYDYFLKATEDAGLRDMRRELLAEASGRTLELGSGTGANVELYPPAVTDLVLTEPDRFMAAKLRSKYPDREVVEAPAEKLPFEDDSFDTVALTLVLCTVPDPEGALREVARVLKPGGRFLFIEHVRAEEESLARWQDRLHGAWYLFGDGCHCNRDTLATLEASPLTVERAEKGDLPKAVPLVRPLLRGAARV
jgi:ubiquinone/menaquinone biosynthesis C-methylase UbiE